LTWFGRVVSGRSGAAGVIHTDFEMGFIRAEISTVADLEKFKTDRRNGVRHDAVPTAEGWS
jgi:ribosome-binding ATPase YchF (GTP1/OBG family)